MVSTTKAAIAIAASASVLSAKNIVQFDLQKHRGSISAKSVTSKDTTHNLSFDLINQSSFFSVDILVGTPAQNPITLVIDTGSSDMWVNGASVCIPGTYKNPSPGPSKKRYTPPSPASANYAFAAAPNSTVVPPSTATLDCSQFGAFDPDLSSSWKPLDLGQTFEINYVDGSHSIGNYGTDSLSINGVSVPNTIFAVSNSSNLAKGVLGISLPKDESLFTSQDNGTTYNNLPQTLKADGLISKVSYSLFLNSLCDKSGSLLFGAINPDWYTGELNTVPLVNIYPHASDTPTEFDITVNGVGIANFPAVGNRKTVTNTKFAGVLDSGTTFMQLPPNLAFSLAGDLGFTWQKNFGYFVGECPSNDQQKDASIVFNIGDVNYHAPLANFVYTTNNPELCAFIATPFVSNGGYVNHTNYSKYNNYAILGDVLLTSLVAVYDLESYEISLGVANYEGYASGSSEVQEIISTVPGAKKAPGYSNTWTTWEFVSTYTGDESDGIFTNKDEVNPWIATASFGCGLDPTPESTSAFHTSITVATSSLVSSTTATNTNAKVTVVTSSSAASSVAPSSSATSSVVTSSVVTSSVVTSSVVTSSVVTSSVVTSSVAASSVAASSVAASSVVASSAVASSAAPSSGVASSVISSSAALFTSAATSVASSAAASNATAAATTLTVSDKTTTLVTITSCKNDACKTTTSAALFSVATLTIEGTVTQYTTYCPISGSSSTSAVVVSTSSSSAVASAASSSVASSASSSAAPGSSSVVRSTTIPSTIGTSTIGSSSSISSTSSVATSKVSSTVPKPSVATSSTPANVTVSVSSVNGGALQIAGSFMAFAAGLVAVL